MDAAPYYGLHMIPAFRLDGYLPEGLHIATEAETTFRFGSTTPRRRQLVLRLSVLTDCLRGRANAVAFLATQSAASRPGTHLLVVAELLTGARDKSEQSLIDSFLQTFDPALPNEADGLMALDLYRKFRLSHGVDWPDCQIAVTALRLDTEVFTQNVKHISAFPRLRVARAY